MSDKHIKSPCINVCVLNADDICEGCYRSMQEITQWSRYDESMKREVMEKTRQRRIEDGAVL